MASPVAANPKVRRSAIMPLMVTEDEAAVPGVKQNRPLCRPATSVSRARRKRQGAGSVTWSLWCAKQVS